jgi:hypothetical protein
MDAEINNVIYMELHLGPKMVNGTRGKTIVAGMIDRGSAVLAAEVYQGAKRDLLPYTWGMLIIFCIASNFGLNSF